MESEWANLAIRRIAEALGVPEQSFHDRRADAADPLLSHADQAAELLEIFMAIHDPTARVACLEFVRDRLRGELHSAAEPHRCPAGGT